MRLALPPLILVLLLSGCRAQLLNGVPEGNLEQQQQQQIPYIPIQRWSTLTDLPLEGSVSARMVFSDNGDLYYAYAQSMYSSDNPRDGLPNLHLRLLPRGELVESELPVPSLPTGTTTSAILALQTDGVGNLYLLYSTYFLPSDTVSAFFYRYAAGSTTPVAVTLPTGFLSSTRTGSGLHIDRATGKIYFAGIHVTSTTSVAAVAVSADGGTTWSIVDASSVTGTSGFGVSTDSTGRIYLAGSKPGTTGSSWVVYRSLADGSGFSELDSVAPSAAADGASARADYVAVDFFGRIVVAGTDVTDPDQQGTAIVVRESSDSGTTFRETARFSARASTDPQDKTPGFVQARGLALGPSGLTAIPVLEGKHPSAYLLTQVPGLNTWTTALSITNLNDGEPYIQGATFDPTNGSLYLLTNYLKYTERQSRLRLTRLDP